MTQTQSREGGRDSGDRTGDLRASPMMAHLMDALERGEDIGHYGRLTFAMVAQYFLDDEELIRLLSKDSDVEDGEAKALVAEVRAHGYNPPKRDQILRWQQEQEFPICPDPDDPSSCNVYSQLQFPHEVYDNIERFWQERAP